MVGSVHQQPALFDLSIMDNIRFGKLDVTKDEVIIAAKKANAFDFIMKLPRQEKCKISIFSKIL